jgi:hypothetical protein
LKYVGPCLKVSLSIERSTAYFTSFDVTTEPSSNLTPLRILYVQVLASALGLPSSSARSGTSLAPSAPGAEANITRERPYNRTKFQEYA